MSNLLIINNKRFITNFPCTMIYLNISLASSCNILHCSRTAHPSRTAPLEPTCTGLCEIEVATSVLHLRWSGIPNRHTSHLMSGMPQAPELQVEDHDLSSWFFGAKSWKEFLSTQKCIVEILKEAQWDTLLKMRFLAVSTSRRTVINFNKKIRIIGKKHNWDLNTNTSTSKDENIDILQKKQPFLCWRCLKPSSSTEKWISAFHTATKFLSFILAMVSPPKAACARLSRSCSTSSRSWNFRCRFQLRLQRSWWVFSQGQNRFTGFSLPSTHPIAPHCLEWIPGGSSMCLDAFGGRTTNARPLLES